MHKWASEIGDFGRSVTPGDVAQLAIKLKDQELSLLSSWLGVDVQDAAQKVIYKCNIQWVAMAAQPVLRTAQPSAFDYAPLDWFSYTSQVYSEKYGTRLLSMPPRTEVSSYFSRLHEDQLQSDAVQREIEQELDFCAKHTTDNPSGCEAKIRMNELLSVHLMAMLGYRRGSPPLDALFERRLFQVETLQWKKDGTWKTTMLENGKKVKINVQATTITELSENILIELKRLGCVDGAVGSLRIHSFQDIDCYWHTVTAESWTQIPDEAGLRIELVLQVEVLPAQADGC